MSTTKPYPLPALGVDMLSEETSLIKGTVRSAVNVDIGRAGDFSRRAGQTLRLAGPGYHSLWVAQQRRAMFVGKGAAVHQVAQDMTTELLAPLNSGDPLNFVDYNGDIYWANKTTIGWLPAYEYVARTVGVPTPEANPVLSVTNGGLLPGKYGVCITFVDDRGEEGGATAVQVIDLPDGGGISLSGLPTGRVGWQVYVYITDPDGERLRFGGSFPAVFPSYQLGEAARGSECETQFLTPMPPGDFVTWLAGRLYTAKNDVLYFSEALRPRLCNMAHNFVQFSGLISFVEAVTDGLYVGDARGVWFLKGTDPSKFEMTQVSTCRAVRRSSIKIPPEHLPEDKVPAKTPVALWLSTSGYVVGMDGGATVELQPERVKVPAGLVGRTMYVLRRGIKQVLTPVNSTSTVAFGTAVDSTIPPISSGEPNEP